MEDGQFVEYIERELDTKQYLSMRDYDLSKLCRICLSTENNNMVSLATNNKFLLKMFTSISLISVDQDDGLPLHICEPCKTLLMSCYEFKLKCQRSDSILKSVLNSEYSAKDETMKYESISDINEKDEISDNTSQLESSVLEDYDQLLMKQEKELAREDVKYFEEYKDTPIEDDTLSTIQHLSKKKKGKILSVTITDSKSLLKDVINKKKSNSGYIFGKSFVCIFCAKTFFNSKKLQDHIIQKHDEALEKPAYACSECKNTFDSESDFHLHLALHTNGNWKCNRCYKEFKSRSVLRRHIQRHMESKPYSCQDCDKSFTELYALRRHCRVHTGLKVEKKYACNQCEKRYSDSKGLSEHVASQHNNGARPYICLVCEKAFSTPRLLASHMNVHSEHKRYACRYCDKRFRHKSTRNAHYRTHTGEKPYVCSTCGKSFIQHTNLTLHMRQHTGERPYACTMCERKFASRTTLVNHIRTHTGEKPFSCNVCGKRFARRGLKAHMRQHTGERPHVCSVCPKTFSNATRLREHSRTHTGEKPFECDKCGHKCGSKSHLVDHLKSHQRKKKERKQIDDAQKIRRDQDNANFNVDRLMSNTSEYRKESLDAQEIPIEVSEELVLGDSGTAIEGHLSPDYKNGICISNGANDDSYSCHANLINVNEEEIKSTVIDRSTVKLYQVDQSLVRIHSSGGQLTISKITSKMTANF